MHPFRMWTSEPGPVPARQESLTAKQWSRDLWTDPGSPPTSSATSDKLFAATKHLRKVASMTLAFKGGCRVEIGGWEAW